MKTIQRYDNAGTFDEVTISSKHNQDLIITVNGVNFTESEYDTFIIHGEENMFPFINGYFMSLYNHWRYRSLWFNNKFYVPVLSKQQ